MSLESQSHTLQQEAALPGGSHLRDAAAHAASIPRGQVCTQPSQPGRVRPSSRHHGIGQPIPAASSMRQVAGSARIQSRAVANQWGGINVSWTSLGCVFWHGSQWCLCAFRCWPSQLHWHRCVLHSFALDSIAASLAEQLLVHLEKHVLASRQGLNNHHASAMACTRC